MYNVTTVRLQRKLSVAFYNGRKVNHLLCFNCFNGYIELLGELGIIDPLVKKFGSFRELKKYAKVAPDPELLGKIKVCIPILGRTSMCDHLSYAVTSQREHQIFPVKVLYDQ